MSPAGSSVLYMPTSVLQRGPMMRLFFVSIQPYCGGSVLQPHGPRYSDIPIAHRDLDKVPLIIHAPIRLLYIL